MTAGILIILFVSALAAGRFAAMKLRWTAAAQMFFKVF
jgi:hypothetical protein